MANSIPAKGFIFWPVGTGDSTTVKINDDTYLQVDIRNMAKAVGAVRFCRTKNLDHAGQTGVRTSLHIQRLFRQPDAIDTHHACRTLSLGAV